MRPSSQHRPRTPALIGARLSNFPTATSALLPAHSAWLDTQAIPLVKTKIAPWIDVIGYASRKGNTAYDQQLSFQRNTSRTPVVI